MKSIITADTHIINLQDSWIDTNGLEFKVNETFKQLDKIIDYAIENKDIKDFFMLGDQFHNKRPIPMYLRMFIERLNKLEKYCINTYIIAGNHETSNSSESALAPISKIDYKYIHVIEGIELINGVHSNYLFVPHLPKSKIPIDSGEELTQEYIDNYIKEEINEKIKKSKRSVIIFGHLQYKKAVVGTEERMLQGGINFFPEVNKKEVKRVFLGHIHKFQMIKYGNIEIVYPGSIVRCDFSERKDDKGFIEYDNENDSWEFVELDTVKYKQINVNLVDKDTIMLNDDKIRESVSGKIIKIVINVSEENKKKVNLEDIEKAFSKHGYVSKVEVNTIKKEKKEIKKISLDPKKVFSEYVNDNIKEKKQKELVNKLGMEIIEEVINNV